MKKPVRKLRRNPEINLVIVSRLKDYIKSKGYRSSADLGEALSEKIKYEIDNAILRAKSNGRQTIRREDI